MSEGFEPVAVVRAVFDACIGVHEQVRAMDLQPVAAAAAAILDASRGGAKVLLFGNGGSAADAQHMASDLVGRFRRERRAVAAMALTCDAAVVTAVANDYAFDRVFVRQVEALGNRGDVHDRLEVAVAQPFVHRDRRRDHRPDRRDRLGQRRHQSRCPCSRAASRFATNSSWVTCSGS